ncbi:CDGSH iron-sulfur domain-containing protein [Streptomyces sp. NPDC088725]|uniref:CDGSH iron-sulfur domain-containing protein n=1 Tax=Streptomyces sp. NPDC088725 TaxID=3365873 RepID=UPI00381E8823
MPNEDDRFRRVTVDRDGPVLIEGPVEVVAEDGSVVTSDRFVVALCACRRSRAYPWCDTSHRGHRRPGTGKRRGHDERPAPDAEESDDGDQH